MKVPVGRYLILERHFLFKKVMAIFKDCSTHQNNTDCIEIEIINEPDAIVCFYFNEEHTTGSMWLEKEEAIRLANYILKICAE